MTDCKWTPGPWNVYADDEVFSRGAQTDQGYPVVVVPDSGTFEFDYGDTMPNKRQCRANAYLIAAAPELADLAVMVMDYCGDPRKMNAHNREELYETAFRCMKKWQGETE